MRMSFKNSHALESGDVVVRKPFCFLGVQCSKPIIGTYGPVRISNEVTVTLMTPPVYLGSKTSQEADDNHTTIVHFGLVQGCHKNTIPDPFIILDIHIIAVVIDQLD